MQQIEAQLRRFLVGGAGTTRINPSSSDDRNPVVSSSSASRSRRPFLKRDLRIVEGEEGVVDESSSGERRGADSRSLGSDALVLPFVSASCELDIVREWPKGRGGEERREAVSSVEVRVVLDVISGRFL